MVYLRFTMTGLGTRRVGPYESREMALWALNILLWGFDVALLEEEIEDKLKKHVMKFPLQKREQIILLEEPYTFRPPYTEPKKGA